MSTSHQDRDGVGEPQVQEVSAGVYAYIQPDGSWFINNTGFLVSRDGVVSIDTTSTERRTRAYLESIAHVTDRPVHTLVNTHHHGDHTHGNCLLPLATVVGHPRCREEILSFPLPPLHGIWQEPEWGDLRRQTDLGRYAALSDSERIVGNLHRAYAELDGAAPGAPIDTQAVLREMVAFHGGPLRCLA